jgi:hypothetical protein
MEKTCPQHGEFRTILWRGLPSYESWNSPFKQPAQPPLCSTNVTKGCPFDCGLCPDHRQHTCCVVLEVTQRCNLKCSFCFAEAGKRDIDPDIRAIESSYRFLLSAGGPYNIQLSGGEPTLRDDLPEIIALGRSLGYSYLQLNTNGLRLAEDAAYVRRLKEAGLGCVFLQFDGTNDGIYKRIRGAALLDIKTQAIAHCAEYQLGVVLVPTLIPGVNTEDIGQIINYAQERMPAVRGVHFQPVSYFGRYPATPADADRITLPEVMTAIERQTTGKIRVTDFHPPSAENAHCSFSGTFALSSEGELVPSGNSRASGCCGSVPTEKTDEAQNLVQLSRGPIISVPGGAKKAREFVARRWVFPASNAAQDSTELNETMRVDSLDAFLEQANKRSLCISGMAFQDAWNIDLERLRDCFIHVVGADKRIIPFCAYNLTTAQGDSLYRPNPGTIQGLITQTD